MAGDVQFRNVGGKVIPIGDDFSTPGQGGGFVHEENPETGKKAGAAAVGPVLEGTQVVDDGGNPLEVFHGTARAFDEFGEVNAGAATGNPTAGWGHFFTAHRPEAERYAEDFGGGSGQKRVISAFLGIKNPYEMSNREFQSLSTPPWTEMNDAGMEKKRVEAEAFKKDLVSEGHDGIFIGSGKYREYVAFKPEQIVTKGSKPIGGNSNA